MTVARLVISIGDRIREAVILCRNMRQNRRRAFDMIFWDSSFNKKISLGCNPGLLVSNVEEFYHLLSSTSEGRYCLLGPFNQSKVHAVRQFFVFREDTNRNVK